MRSRENRLRAAANHFLGGSFSFKCMFKLRLDECDDADDDVDGDDGEPTEAMVLVSVKSEWLPPVVECPPPDVPAPPPPPTPPPPPPPTAVP